MVTVLFAKDAYVTGLDRNFNFKAQHILQEAEVFEKAAQPTWLSKLLGLVGLSSLSPSSQGRPKRGKSGIGKTAPMPVLPGSGEIHREYQAIVP